LINALISLINFNKKKKFFIFTLSGILFICNSLSAQDNQSKIIQKELIQKKETIVPLDISKEEKSLIGSIQKDYYLIGPGDVLELTLLDVPEFSGEYGVLNDGTITLPLIGSIYLKNLSIDQASKIIEEKYRDQLLRPELHLIVKLPRPIRVSIVGEINMPGIYSLSKSENNVLTGARPIRSNGLPTIVDAIQKAGGITQNTDLRKVIVLRRMPGLEREYKKTEVNLIDLIFEGNHEQNLFLFDGDVIKLTKTSKLSENNLKIAQANLSPKSIDVRVIGQVKSPGLIELKSNTPLIQAIYSAGGPIKWKANKGNVVILRVNPNGTITKKKYKINLGKDISFDNNPPLKDKDIVYVNSSTLNNISTGLGAITEPISPFITALSLFKLLN